MIYLNKFNLYYFKIFSCNFGKRFFIKGDVSVVFVFALFK